MNIDERLERLTERHEALTQTVEYLVIEFRETFTQINQALANLVKVAESHERRLDQLEGR
jgi:hypothetical protein